MVGMGDGVKKQAKDENMKKNIVEPSTFRPRDIPANRALLYQQVQCAYIYSTTIVGCVLPRGVLILFCLTLSPLTRAITMEDS